MIEEIQDPLNDYSGDDPWPVSDQDTNYDAKKRKYYSKFHDTTFDQNDEIEPLTEDSDKDLETPVSSDPATEEDYQGSSDDEIPFEQFTAPNLNDLFDFETETGNNTKFDNSWIWILLWIFQFQSKF